MHAREGRTVFCSAEISILSLDFIIFMNLNHFLKQPWKVSAVHTQLLFVRELWLCSATSFCSSETKRGLRPLLEKTFHLLFVCFKQRNISTMHIYIPFYSSLIVMTAPKEYWSVREISCQLPDLGGGFKK